MGSGDDLIESLQRAVDASPDDLNLRLLLVERLLKNDRRGEAIAELAEILRRQPSHAEATTLMARVLDPSQPVSSFDWDRAESELDGIVPPMFVDGVAEPAAAPWDLERSTVRLSDVGGLDDVKQRLDVAFLAPLRNPELRALYGKRLRGGLLLYGPPGCGKSFIARALAGELEASLITVSIHDVLDMWLGRSERNIHELFELARRNAPAVLFMDELDALGRRRSQLNSDGMRTTVNQLLSELDGIQDDNEGLFVLGATNQPWDIDPALKRPGRFDRLILVTPPDRGAREAIFRTHLRERPVASVDLGRLAARTEGYSGADIAHVCETAAERVIVHAIQTGDTRMLEMPDLEAALDEVRPSTGPWFEAARNVMEFANGDGSYDDLVQYVKKRRR